MGSVDLRSKSMNLRAEGALQLNSSNHNIVTGDYTINANKSIKMSATFGSKESINGLLTFGFPGEFNIGKQINILAGKMEVNSINPLGGFDVNVGPVGSLTSSSMNALGFDFTTLGRYSLDAKLKIDMSTMGPVSISSSTIGSVTMENALGTVSVGSIGKIAIENKIFIDCRKLFDSRMFYTAISRARKLEQIYIID